MTRPDGVILQQSGVISDFFGNLKMVDETSVEGLPPSVMDLLRIFLTASTRGEQVSLVLESRNKTITSKYWCVEKMAGTPASTHTPTRTKKKNPARLRRSKARQEAFFSKKQEEAKSSQMMTAYSKPNKAAAGSAGKPACRQCW